MNKIDIDRRYKAHGELYVADIVCNRRFLKFCHITHKIKPVDFFDMPMNKLLVLLEECLDSSI